MSNKNACFGFCNSAGLIKSLAVLLVLSIPMGASAQYTGAESCTGCHDTQYEDWMTSGHRFILMGSQQARHRALPLPAGQKWDDISYVIGGNKTRAVYLDDQGYIMQDQFNLQAGEWSDAHGGGMVPYDCAACHSTGYDEAGNQDGLPGFTGTFALPGVQCEHCHGPGDNFTTGMQPGSTDPAFCGTCHNHGPEGTVAASDGFIMSEGQYNEWMASPHNSDHPDAPGCVGCHDPHKRVEDSVKADCESCHAPEAAQYAGTLMDKVGVGCTDCHMAPATLSGQPLGPQQGDMKSHIFNINTNSSASMFTPDGSQLALADGEAAVTLDFVCQGCHTGTSLETLAKFSVDFHSQDGSLENIGLNPGLSGTWWNANRSGEGFLVEFASFGPTPFFFGSMYTYDSAGELFWLTFQPTNGVPTTGTTIDVTAYISSGGAWGDALDPGNVSTVAFGTGAFTFETCTSGSVSITPDQAYIDLGFTPVAYETSRFMDAGVDCPTFENNTEMAVVAE